MKSIRSESGRILRSSGAASRTFPAALSFGAVALDGHSIDPKGWVYPETVPLVDSHLDGAGIKHVLGRVSNIRVGAAEMASGRTATALLGSLNFAAADVNPDAEVAYQLYASGFASAVSVSFIPLVAEYANERGRPAGGLNISSAKLLEVSVCAVPSDENARVLARAISRHRAGRDSRADRDALARAIIGRVARSDAAAGGLETPADRAARARSLAGGDSFDDLDLRRRLLE